RRLPTRFKRFCRLDMSSHDLPTTLSFFFQAEDGIRDRNVTGVQTCALPISRATAACHPWSLSSLRPLPTRKRSSIEEVATSPPRSEERRVGKGCRSRRAPDHEIRKKGSRKRQAGRTAE